MSNRLGTYKAGEAFENFRVRLRKFTEKEISPTEYMRILNMNTDEFVGLSGSMDDSDYKDSLVITSYGDNGTPGGSLDHVGISYNSTTRILTVNNAAFAANFSVDFINFNTTNPIGARILVFPDFSAQGVHETYVEEKIDANNVKLASGLPTGVNAAGPGLLICPGGITSVNLAAYGVYKNIERITGIYSNIHGECTPFTLQEYMNITKPSLYQFSTYRDQVIYARAGENLLFAFGDLDNMGVRTMYFIRTPYHVTSLTDYVDLKDKNFNMVQDMNLLDGLQTLKVPMPEEMKSAQQRLQLMRKAKDEELAKQLSGVE